MINANVYVNLQGDGWTISARRRVPFASIPPAGVTLVIDSAETEWPATAMVREARVNVRDGEWAVFADGDHCGESLESLTEMLKKENWHVTVYHNKITEVIQ